MGSYGTDVLVVKSITVAGNDTCQKWTPLSAVDPYVTPWTPISERLAANDRVIVLVPGTTTSSSKSLITSGTAFSTTFSNVTSSSSWRPASTVTTYVVYGVDPSTDLRMPFNRADYYVRQPTTGMPSRCAPNTGILYKGVLKQSDGTHTELPLLDCVADMQVVYGLDNNEDGSFDPSNDPADSYGDASVTSTWTALQIRNRVKQVRVYILAHEGQRDPNYTYPNSTIAIPASPDPGAGLGSTFSLSTTIGNPDYKYYRWKLYTIVATLNDLR